MKRKILALIISICMTVSVFPVTAYAGSAFDFIRDPSGNRIGIRSIMIDGVTYYDIYDGDANAGKNNSGSNLIFLKDVLTKPDSTAGGAAALDYWSQLAYLVFEDNSYYSSLINASGGFNNNFGRRPNDAGYMDMVRELKQTSPGNRGNSRSDNTRWTGLSYSTSLKDIRLKMANEIAAGIGRDITGTQILNNTGTNDAYGSTALKLMDVETKGDAFYSIVTSIDRVGATYQYYYNSFGIAFYDFQLSVISDDGLEYITAAEGFDNVSDAADAKIPGVTYEVLGSSNPMVSYYNNAASEAASVGMEFSQENRTDVSNSFSKTETYSFREMIGGETKLGFDVATLKLFEQSIKYEFTAEQALSTAWTNTKSVSHITANRVSSTVNLPAHSVIGMESSDGTIKVTLDYDCPVAITYKVGLFALSGDCYDDSAAVHTFSTAGYVQQHFCSILGTDTGDARSDLNNRVFKNREMSNYDEALASTYGWSKRRGPYNIYTVNHVNWPQVLGDVEPVQTDVDYSIECYEVTRGDNDSAGNAQYILKSTALLVPSLTYTNGVAMYENQIGAPNLMNRIPNKQYALVKDAVFENSNKVGGVYANPLPNSFPNDASNNKLEYLSIDPAENVIKFYYVEILPTEIGPRSVTIAQPVIGSAAQTAIEATDFYTATISWYNVTDGIAHTGIFAAGKSYRADVRLTSKLGFAWPAIPPAITVTGATVSNVSVTGSGSGNYLTFQVVYPAITSSRSMAPMSAQIDSDMNDYSAAAPSTKSATSATQVTVNTDILANWLCSHQPMSATGGTISYKSTSMNSNINGIVALYPLTKVKLETGSSKYVMIEGDILELDDLIVNGYNSSDVPYYGFNKDFGKWVLADVTGSQIYFSGVASLSTNPLTGKTYLTAGSVEGTVYLKYLINEDTYKSHTSIGYASDTNSGFKTAFVEINTTSTPFTGRLEARGALTGYSGETLNIYTTPITAYVFDESDKEISAALSWEKRYLNGLTIAGSNITLDQEGEYQIRAAYRGVYSDWVDVKVLPARKLDVINISKDNSNLLDDYILHDTFDTFDLNLLAIAANDQYGDDWTNLGGLIWCSDKGTIAGSTLTVSQDGLHMIWAECAGIKSNELTFNVKPERVLSSIEIRGNIPELDINPNSVNHTYNLNGLTVTAKDQYGSDIVVGSAVWQIESGDDYAAITGSTITGIVHGSGTVRLLYGGNLYSNSIPFTVQAGKIIYELFQTDAADFVVEGTAFDLTAAPLAAKDQWGGTFGLTSAQSGSIIWTISNKVKGTVSDTDVSIAGTGITIAHGSVGYGLTGTVILTATLPDRGDGQAIEVLAVTLFVRQKSIPAVITIGKTDNALLRAGENMRISEFFTIAAKDQYGENYAINTDDVNWASNNSLAFDISADAIFAGDEEESAEITAWTDVTLRDGKVTTTPKITSNVIALTVPGVRRIVSVLISGTPSSAAYGAVLNVNKFIAAVYDKDGIAFTDAELAAYPAKVTYAVDEGGTGTTFDPLTGEIVIGNSNGIVTITAMVGNITSSNTADVKIIVGPDVKSISVSQTKITSKGGRITVTIAGDNLSDGITVSAFDSGGNIICSELTVGTDKKQTSELVFLENMIKNNEEYTLKFMFGGTQYDDLLTAKITVTNGSNAGGGTGGGGSGGSGGSGGRTITDPISPLANPQIDIGDDETPLAPIFPFIDVHTLDWFYGDVEYVWLKSLFNGTSETTFSPNLEMTRAMIVTVLYRLDGSPSVSEFQNPFSDVADGQYYSDAVKWAAANGIVTGIGDGQYNPAAPVTRQDLALILLNYADHAGMTLPGTRDYSGFSDEADMADYAKTAIEQLFKAAVINGKPGNIFDPKGTATRAEVSAMLHRML
jgi:hypothetical protein